jgi:hypothetical protein
MTNPPDKAGQLERAVLEDGNLDKEQRQMKNFTPLVRSGTWLLTAAALAGVLAVGSRDTWTEAADHLDAPGVTSPGGDGRLDINDHAGVLGLARGAVRPARGSSR